MSKSTKTPKQKAVKAAAIFHDGKFMIAFNKYRSARIALGPGEVIRPVLIIEHPQKKVSR